MTDNGNGGKYADVRVGDTQDTTTEPSPTACQVCSKEKGGPPNTAVFAKVVDGEMFIAVICMDCMIEGMGLEWRKAPPAGKVLVPGAKMPHGMMPS